MFLLFFFVVMFLTRSCNIHGLLSYFGFLLFMSSWTTFFVTDFVTDILCHTFYCIVFLFFFTSFSFLLVFFNFVIVLLDVFSVHSFPIYAH